MAKHEYAEVMRAARAHERAKQPDMFDFVMSQYGDAVKERYEKSVARFDSEAASWLAVAKAEIGVKEWPDPGENPRIVEYHSATTYGSTDDEVSWCSSFVNWCMREVGTIGTGSAAARSWLNWGTSLVAPRVGCVVVYWRESIDSWKGHVGFCYEVPKAHDKVIATLGGNQSNSVNVSGYSLARVLGYRWPV